MELSVGKILLILLIVVLVFGSAKLPKLGEDIGKAVRSFKKGMHSGQDGAVPLPKATDDKPGSDSGHSPH
ncbi:MAG: twin-arginine translocase TatA/TatE family subunit [Gammaproteobacteria bacterium]